jgi:hypothetical protein
MIYDPKVDSLFFWNVAKAMYGNLNNAAAVNASSGTDLEATTISITAHGFQAGSNIYIYGTTNYNGISYIHSVATNTITIKRKFVAETFGAGVCFYSPSMSYATPFLFHGFQLSISPTNTTSEDFEVAIYGGATLGYLFKVYDHDMAGVKDIIYSPATPIMCAANDQIECTWDNTDAGTWWLRLFGSRLV